MSQDNENKPLFPANDAVPTPPSGSPLEEALKKAQMEAEGAEAVEEAAAQKQADPDGPSGTNAGTEAAADTSADEASASEQAEAEPKAEGELPAENGTAAEEAENKEQEEGSESLPAERESSVPATQEDDPEEERDGEGGNMSMFDHLREVRKRLVFSLLAAFVGFLCCWCFVEPVFDILTKPMLEVLPNGSAAMYTTLPEAFFTRMYIAFICGLFVASPFIFYQIWKFISPGLYKEEKKFIIPVAVVSAIFFIAGGLFCYYIVFHYAFSFFMSFTTQDIVAMPKISDYLDFVLKLILAFGFVFEMPIFSFFLSRMGVLTADAMRNFRRYAILIIFIVAAILTPPDVVSQLLMAIPMLILYEFSIFVAVIFGKKKAVEEDDSDKEEDEEDVAEDWEKEKEEAGTEAGAETPQADTAQGPSDNAAAETSAEAEPAKEDPAEQETAPEAGADDAPSEKDEAETKISLEKKASPSDKEQPAKGQE